MNAMFYSKLTGGFYSREFNGENMPADVVEITEAEHQALLAGQNAGLRIAADVDGNPVLAAPLSPTPEQLQQMYTNAVQRHMDEAAQALGYDHLTNAVTYADEPAVPKFQSEGLAFRAWRSLVWAYAYGVLNAVQAAEREMPTIQQLIAELPVLELPTEP